MSQNILYLEVGLETVKLLVMVHPELRILDFEIIYSEGLKSFNSAEKLEHYYKSAHFFLTKNNLHIDQVSIVLKDPKIETYCISTRYTAYLSILESLRDKLWETHKVSDSEYEIFISLGQKIHLNHKTYTQAMVIPKSTFAEYRHFINAFKVKSSRMYSLTESLSYISASDTSSVLKHGQKSISQDPIIMTVFVSHAQTSFCLSYKNQSLKNRTLPIGSANFSKVLMGDIIYEGITFTTTIEEAEQIKRLQGITLSNPKHSGNKAPYDHANVKLPASVTQELFSPIIENLRSEIKRFVSASLSEFDLKKIDQVLLLGNGATIKNFDLFLQSEVGTPCQIFECTLPVEAYKQNSWHEMSHEFSHFASMKHESKLTNLLSPTRPLALFRLKLEKYALSITFGLLVILYLCLEFHAQKMRINLLNLQEQWNSRVKMYSHYFYYQHEKKVSLESFVKLSSYQNLKIPWDGFFKYLTHINHPHIQLFELNIETKEDFSLYPSYILILKGKAATTLDNEQTAEGIIGHYMNTLSASPWLKTVHLSYIHADTADHLRADTVTSQDNPKKIFELKAEFNFNHE